MEYFAAHLPPSGARGPIVSRTGAAKGASTPSSTPTPASSHPTSSPSSSAKRPSGPSTPGRSKNMSTSHGRGTGNGATWEERMGERPSGSGERPAIAAVIKARLNGEFGSPEADSSKGTRARGKHKTHKDQIKRPRSPSPSQEWDDGARGRNGVGKTKGGAADKRDRQLEPFPLAPRNPALSKPRTGRMSPATYARLVRERDAMDDELAETMASTPPALKNKDEGKVLKDSRKKNALQYSGSFDELCLQGIPDQLLWNKSKESDRTSARTGRKNTTVLVPPSPSQSRYVSTDEEVDDPLSIEAKVQVGPKPKDKAESDVPSSTGNAKKRIVIGSDDEGEDEDGTDQEETGEAYFNRIHKMRATGRLGEWDHQAELAEIMSIRSSDDEVSRPVEDDLNGGDMDEDDGTHMLTAEERQFCLSFIDPDERCPFCSGQVPLSPSTHLVTLRARLQVVAADLAPGQRLSWQRTIEYCSFHQAEIEVIPLGVRAGYPPLIDFYSIQDRVEQDGIRQAVMRLIREPVSPFFALAEKAIVTMGKGRWSGMEHQSSEKVVNHAMPGYYGQLGRAILLWHYQNLLKWELFPPGVAKTVYPLSPAEFIAHVIVPEVGILLIMEDQGWDGEYYAQSHQWDEARSKAYEVWKGSIEYGRWRFRGDDERAGNVLEELQKTSGEMREKCEATWGADGWGNMPGQRKSGTEGKETKVASSFGMTVNVDSGSERGTTPGWSDSKPFQLVGSTPPSSYHCEMSSGHMVAGVEDGSSDSSDYGDDDDWAMAAAEALAQTEMELEQPCWQRR